MADHEDLFRTLDTDEIEALGPMPADEGESPTTDRDGSSLTAEVHSPGLVEQSSVHDDDDDRLPPPRSLTED